MSTAANSVFNERYEIVRHIARGGMAEVYEARDLLLGRPVALKVLFPQLSTDPSFVERFRREAQAVANLSHPNIVSVYDWGEQDGTYFMVMEYVEGQTLSALLRGEGPLLPDRAADIGADVAAALGFAHRNGVIHRDVKPGNVLLGRDGQVKVTDFGIARALNVEENLTQTGAVMGTATYFSPEQAQGLHLDNRSDVYSLGVVLFELVAGRPPFTGDNPMAIAFQHAREEAPPLRRFNPQVPRDYEAVVDRAMAKDPKLRYASAEELRADLMRFRQGRAVLATASAATVTAPAAPPTAAMPTVAPTQAVPAQSPTVVVPAAGGPVGPPPKRERHTGTYVVLLLVMLLILGGLIFLLWRAVAGPGSTTVAMPSVTGALAADARATLEDAGLEVEQKDEDRGSECDVGVVCAQDPEPNTKVERGSKVTIVVNAGPGEVEMPSVEGDEYDDAFATLRELGLNVLRRDRADTRVPRDRVIDQRPEAGEKIRKGGEVTLTVSSGKESAVVPAVRGKDVSAAIQDIEAAGFVVADDRPREASTEIAAGRVTRTNPPEGASREKGTPVTIYVSSGPEEVEVPDVLNKKSEEARQILQNAGFKVEVREQTTSDRNKDDRVLDQDPNPRDRARTGSTVTIFVGKFQALPTPSSTTSTTSA